MEIKTPTKPWILLVIFLAISAGGFFVFSKSTISNPYGKPVSGKDNLPHVKVIENHKSALTYWLDSGIKNAVLVSIDAHDDIKRIPDSYIQELKVLSNQRVTTSAGAEAHQNFSGKVTNGNFLYAAAKLGIFKEIFWIIPAPYTGTSNQENSLISLLNYYNFFKKDIKTFKMAGNCFKGQVNGIPFSLCDVDSLPDIHEPIVLNIDSDFFPAVAESRSEKLIDSISRTNKALAGRNYKIIDAVLAYSVDGGHLNTYHRWIGDLFVLSLENPLMMSAGKLPDRYPALQQADLLLLMGRYDELLEHLQPFIEIPQPDPAMLTYYAFALAGLNAEAHAYSYAEQACLADKKYCYVLSEIGENLLADHGLDSAEKFFIRGYALNPQMAHGQFNLAQAMIKNNRLDEAIYYLKEFRKANGPFPIDLYLGKTYLLKGDEIAALSYFVNARTELLRNPPALADLGDLNIIQEAIAFFRQKGLDGFAKELKITLVMRDKYYSDRSEIMP